MARRSPLEFDISVSADKARRARARGKPRGMTGKVETADGCCEWPGCTQPGVYRAPRDPDNLDQFRWFCLEHVREYNASW
ncbi:MAG: molecular chaperone DnaJ, partial [Pseudomonadota bacterium]